MILSARSFCALLGCLLGTTAWIQAQSLTGLLVTGGDHAYYIAPNQHICQSYFTGSGWTSQDLTTAAGTNTLAAPGTTLASLVYSNRDYLYYIDSVGHVNQLFYSGSGSTWINQDLTAWAQGAQNSAAAPNSALAAVVYNNAGQVFYFDTNRHISHLWWTGQTWAYEDLTNYTHAPYPAAVGSGLSSYSDANGLLHVYYIDANQHIGHMWWTGQTWLNEDLTAASQTSARVAPGSTLTGYAEANGKAHLFYLDGQPHVDQMWWYLQRWWNQDLTALAGTSTIPAPASGLSSFGGPNGTASVYYVDTQQHINQLSWNGQAWSNQDLSQASAFQLTANTLIYTLATPQTALTSLLITGGNHVYFVATDGHVHQIYWNGQSWVDQDLIVMGKGPSAGSGIGNGSALPYVREYIYGNGQVVAIENGQFGHTQVYTLGNGHH